MNKENSDGLKLAFTDEYIKVLRLSDKTVYIDDTNTKGLIRQKGATYWISLDSQNQTLYAGIGEARMETCVYRYTWSSTAKIQPFLESLYRILPSEESLTLTLTTLLRDPIRASIPLLIKDTDDLTMNDIAKATYLPRAHLSTVSKQLYDCISGKQFVLDDGDFPDFSKAIQHSIITPGLWCNTRLKEKANEFSKDKPNPDETYLRITLNQNNGESPGIPYVMEIWPAGHYSPIHNHGESSAIIRILHGSIQMELYPFLCESESGIKPFTTTHCEKDDITWISPTLNQIHKLTNITNDSCITIQCYMYESDNTTHYDYFDYINADGKEQQYTPDSDMDFLQFKALMKTEWDEHQPLQSITKRPRRRWCKLF